MSNDTKIIIDEGQYVDPRAGNDKFYRTFVVGDTWVTSYGRNGTAGTVTKSVQEADEDAAVKAAGKKFAAKVKKGYEPTRQGTVSYDGTPDLDDATVLDMLASQLPLLGDGQGSIDAEPVPVAAVDEILPDRTGDVVLALEGIRTGHVDATTEHTDPALPTRPMLASTQPQSSIESMLDSDNWVAQLKYDGDRVVVEIKDGQVTVLNRQGQAKVRNVGAAHTTPFTALHTGRWVFDGEVVGRTLVLFDMLVATHGDRTWVSDDTPFGNRHKALVAVAGALGLDADDTFAVAPVADDLAVEGAKADLLATAVAGKREGIVLRDRNGRYEQGRRSTFLVKHKLIKDADVVVTALHDKKESATLSVHEADGTLREVGAASTIGKGTVSVGDVWVVTYLYVTDPANPRLFQPRLVTRREDKAASECDLAQFADAGTDRSL